MKLRDHNNSLDTNFNGQSQSFGIGDASVVIEILRNRLYKHKLRTMVQEYICNARDAMREVGNTGKIVITVPNKMSPVFKVRDFGPGLSPDRIANVFVNYGSSTKRGSNGQTGGFGIGAKSAWSYTDSFTIVSYFEGVKRTYVAHTGVDNNGRLDQIAEEQSSEPSGVEIQVAISSDDINNCAEHIRRILFFWPDSSYEIKGSLEFSIDRDEIKLNDRISILATVNTTFSLSYNDILVNLDGVPYIINTSNFKELMSANRLVQGTLCLRLDTGELDISASREEISINDTNEKVISSLSNGLEELISKYTTEQLKSNNITEFIDKRKSLSKYILVNNFCEYKKFIIYHNNITHKEIGQSTINKYKISSNMAVKHITSSKGAVSSIDLSLKGVYKHDGSLTAKDLNKHIRGTNRNTIILLDTTNPVSNEIATALNIPDITSVPMVQPSPRIPRAKGSVKPPKSIVVHGLFQNHKKQYYSDIKAMTGNYVYFIMDSGSFGTDRERLRELDRFLSGKGLSIIGISKSSSKDVVDMPNFIEYTEWLKTRPFEKEIVARLINRMSKECSYSIFSLICKDDVKDIFLKNRISLHKDAEYSLIPVVFENMYKDHTDLDKPLEIINSTESYLKKYYPLLLERITDNVNKDLEFYINSKYSKLKKEGLLK